MHTYIKKNINVISKFTTRFYYILKTVKIYVTVKYPFKLKNKCRLIYFTIFIEPK